MLPEPKLDTAASETPDTTLLLAPAVSVIFVDVPVVIGANLQAENVLLIAPVFNDNPCKNLHDENWLFVQLLVVINTSKVTSDSLAFFKKDAVAVGK